MEPHRQSPEARQHVAARSGHGDGLARQQPSGANDQDHRREEALVLIRPETSADYADIAATTARAFEHRSAEAVIVALLRQRRAYDPELALVAVLDGRVVGHVMFSAHTIRL